MTTQNLTLMNALGSRMGFLEENQKHIAQNIANADTPGYRPQELKPQDFRSLLRNSTSAIPLASGGTGMTYGPNMTRTDSKHIGVNGAPADQKTVERRQKETYEMAPAGNAVILEEQLLKMNANYTEHRFITNLYQKNVDMLKLSVRDGQ